MEEKNEGIKNMTVDRTAVDGEQTGADSTDRELLIFGEGGGSFTKEPGPTKFSKRRSKNIILLVLLGVLIGAGIALAVVSAITGGLKNLHYAKTLSEHDFTVIGDLLEHIEDYHFGDPLDEKKLIDKASHALVDAMEDPYASYFTPSEHDSYSASFNGNYSGIGIVVYNPDGNGALIHRVYEGSFAETAGLLAGDVIIAVDGVDIKTASGTELVERITGEAGTTVDITFLRGEEEMTTTVTRGEVYVKRVEHAMLEGDIGYIALTSFSGYAETEFRDALNAVTEAGAKGLIVDLRGNPGGSLGIVVNI
ncbi:MAG: PDZ domain-containing protein, partial [Clostridia bacterium]|nr:PDZ domain-containing protein [Clostridia bacterium]